MEVSASTDDNSTFFMPLSGKSNISYADFVTFVEPPQAEQDIVTRKKLSFERRRSAKAEGGSQMEIALALDVRPNVEVELTVSGNTLKARGAGVLNLSINPRTNLFEMYGDYTLSEGSFQLSLQNIINKRFVIEDGSTIQWTGSPMDALLNIEAVYKLKASLQPLLQGTSDRLTADRSVPVECVIRLGDRLNLDGTDAMTIPQLKRAIIKAVKPTLRLDGQSEVYIDAAFAIARDEVEARKGTEYQRRQMFNTDSAPRKAPEPAGATARRNQMIEDMDGGNE